MTPNMSEFIELDWLKRWAMVSPNAVALKCADTNRTFTYSEFFERSAELAKTLKREYGIVRGDRVAILAMNEPEHFFLFFALQRLGAILVPINFRLAAREIDHVLNDSGAKVFFFQEQYADLVNRLEVKSQFVSFQELQAKIFDVIPAEPSAMEGLFEDPCMILYTSGTTGKPKGALITNKMLFWNSVNTGLRLNVTQKDSAVIFHPFFHTSGWNVLTTPFFHHGARITLLKKFDAEKVLQLAEAEKVSVLFGVPTMMDMMARTGAFDRANLKSVRYAIVGGEPMPIPLIEEWAKKGIPVRQGYGLTEFGPNVFSLNEEDSWRKIGSIGFPNFYVDVKVVNAEGMVVTEPDLVGELCLRGPACSPGYWKNEAATRDAIRDGWFHTGDLVRFDSEGYFYVVGRKKDMFISGGENVYPAEVEGFLRTHPRVHEVAVVGVKDERWGEVGMCFYSSKDGSPLNDDDLKGFALGNLAKYKIPKHYKQLTELPKGESGKIQKRNLLS
jgi:fatty-acyl-CoA synthase